MSKKLFRFWLILIPYIILLYGSLFLAILFRYGKNLGLDLFSLHLEPFTIIFIFWLVVFFVHGLFDISVYRRYTTIIFNLISASLVNLLVATVYFYFRSSLITPKRILLIDVAVTFVALFFWNLAVKFFVKNSLTEKLYLFSFANELNDLEQIIQSHSYLGYKVIGHLNEQLLASEKIEQASGIVLPDNLHANPSVANKLYKLRTSGMQFYNYKDFYEKLLRRIYLSAVNELWFLENINYQEKRFYNLAKRIVDIFFGFVGFASFVVSYPVCALLIKLSDRRGPILFVQERVGRKGKTFKVYKYRTMLTGTATNTWTSVEDPRIFPVGKFLRKSRVDEWPQFINLIIGNMSLVGPRPEQPHLVTDLSRVIPFYEERHFVKPGLTGWAQINNIYAGTSEETKLKLQYDLYYIKHRSILFDLEIILKTIYYIFTWRGR